MKVFLSYSSSDKKLAGKVKEALEDYGLEVFLAHEDINPSDEWVETIIAELETCDVFLPILTENFGESDYTDQETGIAIARKKLIIPVKVTTNPHGFVSRYQAAKLDISKIRISCHNIAKVVSSKPVLGDLFRDGLIRKFGDSWNFDSANHNTEILLSFEGYNLKHIKSIVTHTIKNTQINQAFKARRALDHFVYQYKKRLGPDIYQEFQSSIS